MTTRTESPRMTDHEHEAEAALAALDATGLKAVRLLYTDLHGVARGKDIPLRHFPGMAGDGVTFCGAVMGTDLRHTPVVGGAEGYVDLAVRPDLNAGGEGSQLTVVTNALNIANELLVRSRMKIVVTGGVVRPQSFELV